ncbi:MAG: acetolactate synthase small subunit [Bacteriovoracaceae bacterium]|nr:acetolactate synthase small subunit [Bacteriovoracaceae bacterium]
MKHIISILVEDKPGVLARISGLFSRRGYNIDSLAVGESETPPYSKMTVVVQGKEHVLEQITKQLHKLIDVYKVIDLTSTQTKFITRELVLIKICTNSGSRSEIMQIVHTFRGRIIDVSEKSMNVEIVGDDEKIEAIVKLFNKFGILEIVRSGKIAISRGSKTRR